MRGIKRKRKKKERIKKIVVTRIESNRIVSSVYHRVSLSGYSVTGRRTKGVVRNGNHQIIFTLPVKLFSLAQPT